MTDNASILSRILLDPTAPVDKQWVLQMMQSHPCFYLLAALLLKRAPESVDKATLQRLQTQVMMNCADRTAILDFVDPYNAGWDSFYPKDDGKKVPTEQTIDDFLKQFGQGSSPEEDALLERLIFNPVPADYFGGTDEPFDESDPLSLPPELRKEESKEHSTLKDATAEQSGPKQISDISTSAHNEHDMTQDVNPAPENYELANEESLLTESLVKIFIKRHNYERALDIISRLSLNYPEKSVYFADQKRFLKKLIINQQYLNIEK